MRLIRTTTSDPKARFDGILDDDVVIEPNSAMALESLALEINEQMLDLRDDASRVLTWSLNGTEYTTNRYDIPTKIYALDDYKTLLDSIRKALNHSVDGDCIADAGAYTSATTGGAIQYSLGGEWDIATTQQGRMEITWKKGSIGSHETEFNNNKSATLSVADAASVEGNTVREWSSTPGSGTTVMLSETPIAGGTGYIEALLFSGAEDEDLDTDRNGFMVCLSKTDLSNYTPAEIAADPDKFIDYGVGVNFEPGNDNMILVSNYKDELGDNTIAEVNQGNLGFPAVADSQESNPRVRVLLDKGDVRLLTSDGQGVALANLAMDYNGAVPQPGLDRQDYQLWPFIVMYADNNYCSIAEVCVALSPNAENAPAPGYTPPAGSTRALWPLRPIVQATDNNITFPSRALADYLGFADLSVPVVGTSNGITFTALANFRFGPRITNTTLIVLCDSFELDSYDTSVNGRKSILAVVPVERRNEGSIVISNTLNYISIKNTTSTTLRNLKLRIVDGDYRPIDLFGTASMVLFVRGPNEA